FHYVSMDPRDGLVGWWKLDDGTGTTALDSSGYGDNGTLSNGPAWTSGPLVGSLSFDGLNDYVSCPIASIYDFDATNNFTIAMWINADPSQPASNGFPGLMRKDRGSGDSYLFGIRSSD